jgi:tetratricopeptide (TPR) repeat protein
VPPSGAPRQVDPHPAAAHPPDRAIAPETTHALFMRGVVLHRKGAPAAAEGIALIRQAIALNARVAEAHCNLGNGLRELCRYEGALTSSDQAIALKPDYADALRNRAATVRSMQRQS